ncbi:Lrp/AsnC family transcriptional regulator [Neptunomonas antarctica]|uniref:Transcriptional regulator, AsnC family n=1 Tax=Neptunomonas antarctica TaxID=619304 RepID=A0A1N7N937_9GAMM|nr:Lrp/AsnC family transcriptional regulator [Neptunomonas antarctica]SIS94850.1 transcriptional regulator, AsnC family [Neptunomonas antarctica]
MRLDRYDIQILQILHEQGRITKSALADTINLSVSPCWERVKRLEEAGIIEGYGARINSDRLFKRSPVLLEVSLKQHSAEAFKRFEIAAQECKEVVECYATGGGVDYILKVMCEDIDQYQRLIDRWLASDLGIEKYYTYIVTKTIKQQQQALAITSNAVEDTA